MAEGIALERWLRVVGHPSYEVSSLGRVYSHRSRRILSGTTGRRRGCTYRSVSLYLPGHGNVMRDVHVLVCTAFHGDRPQGFVTRHLNGDPLDNRESNLAWGPPRENMLDVVRHGRHELVNRTHCPREHELAEPNLIKRTEPERAHHRECRACALARADISQARRRGYAVIPDLVTLADEKYRAMGFDVDLSRRRREGRQAS